MIFVILGTQKHQFDRLLKQIDVLIEKNVIQDEVFAQIGNSSYTPVSYGFKRFLSKFEFDEIIKKSSLVLTHAGTGSIMTALKYEKIVIAV
ncbi:MAG: glycosyltransferase, partial [Peptostreptococcus porci]|nr:glycosyltransferase [Peptostreptococcus porci]